MDSQKEGWSCLLFLICVETTIGVALPVGYCFSALNGNAEYIQKWTVSSCSSRYGVDLSAANLTLFWSTIVAIFKFGGILGSLIAPACNGKLGRLGTLQLTGVIFVISAVCISICHMMNSLELLLLGRILGGVGAALVFSTLSMYLVELAPVELSGSVGVFTCIGLTGGIIMGQVLNFGSILGTDVLWPLGVAAFVVFTLIGMIPSVFFPESPRYLMFQGNKDAAKAALLRLRKNPQRVEQEIASIESGLKVDSSNLSMIQCCKDSKLTMALILVTSISLVQAGCGVTMIWNYSVGIYVDAGFDLKTANWINFSIGIINFVASLCASFLMFYFNRRTMMMLSCAGAMFCMLFITIGLSVKNEPPELAMACIAIIAIYIIFLNVALASLPYFIASEIFLDPPRAAAMAMGSLTNWTGMLILNFFFPTLYNLIGGMAFLICVFFLLFGLLVTFRYLPETRNRKAEEIAPLLEDGFKSKIK